jgi:hypothetical protein
MENANALRENWKMVDAFSIQGVLIIANGIKVHNAAFVILDFLCTKDNAHSINIVEKMDS